jgi:hypothetical protein
LYIISNSITKTLEQFDDSLDKYLNSLKSESIYVRELDKILTNLPCICTFNILSIIKLDNLD